MQGLAFEAHCTACVLTRDATTLHVVGRRPSPRLGEGNAEDDEPMRLICVTLAQHLSKSWRGARGSGVRIKRRERRSGLRFEVEVFFEDFHEHEVELAAAGHAVALEA